MHDTDRDELPRDIVFDLLSDPRRRFVVSYLVRADGPVPLDDLAAEVAAWEEDVPVETIDRQERKRVYVSLYQTHVPKLADAGVVEYDSETRVVSLADRGHSLAAYLAQSDGERDWADYYLVAAVLGAAVYFVMAFDAPGLATLPDAAAVGLVVVAFAAIALAQAAATGRLPRPEPRR